MTPTLEPSDAGMDEAALARFDAAVQADIDAGRHFGAVDDPAAAPISARAVVRMILSMPFGSDGIFTGAGGWTRTSTPLREWDFKP